MAVQTDASKYVQQTISALYSLAFGGTTGPCRYIGGGECGTKPGTTYSQHSWGNALDIYPSRSGLPFAEVKAWLDPVHDFLEANQTSLGIKVLLWQVADHYNHIHADFWPSGINVPACCAGVYQNHWRRSNGETFYTGSQESPPAEAEGPISNPNEIPLHLGDESALVQHYQERMLVWVPAALPNWGADGDFGTETEQWARYFQNELGVTQTGIIDQVLADFLDSDPLPPPEPPDPPDPEDPPIPPDTVPLPELDVGQEGDYRKFFYPRKGH